MGKKILWILLGCLMVVVLVSVTYQAVASDKKRHEPKGSVIIAASDLATQPVDPHYTTCSQDEQTFRPRTVCGRIRTLDPRNGKWINGLITSWKVDSDGLTWTLDIRKGVKFHSGNEVTAHDYEYSWKKVQTKGRAIEMQITVNNNYFENLWAVDDYTLKVKTNKPSAPFPVGSPAMMHLVDSKYIEKVGDEEFKKNPSTCGFYKFAGQKYGEYIKLEASDEWYYMEPHRPYTKYLKYIQVPELASRMAMLKTGEVDIATDLIGPAIPEAKAAPGIRTASAKEIDMIEIILTDFLFPKEPSPMHDKRIRQALAYAINRKAIAKKLYFGEAGPQKIPSASTWQFGSDATIPGYPYNPEKAKALLREAGYAKGFEVKLIARPQHMEVGMAVQGFWKRIGLDAKLEQIEVGIFQRGAVSKTLRGNLFTTVPTMLDIAGVYKWFYIPKASWGWNSDPEMFKRHADVMATFDNDEREKKMKEMVRYAWENLPSRIPVIARNGVYGLGPRVKEFVPGIYNWWRAPEWLVMKD